MSDGSSVLLLYKFQLLGNGALCSQLTKSLCASTHKSPTHTHGSRILPRETAHPDHIICDCVNLVLRETLPRRVFTPRFIALCVQQNPPTESNTFTNTPTYTPILWCLQRSAFNRVSHRAWKFESVVSTHRQIYYSKMLLRGFQLEFSPAS